MLPFSLQRATSIETAIAAGAAGQRFIAGGTTLIDLMREEVERPRQLLDINALPLSYVRVEGDVLLIGALTRMAVVATHPEVASRLPLVAETLLEGASPQIRNMATIGGNLLQRNRCPYFRMLDAACNKRNPGSGCSAIGGLNGGHAVLGTSASCAATHPSDLAVTLVALDAVVRVRGPAGERSFPVEQLYRLPEETPHLEHTLRPGELILDVRIPLAGHDRRARYLKVRDRASYEYALVSAAAAIQVEASAVRSVRIACGGVGTRPWRMRACEQALIGGPATREAFGRAAALAAAGATALPHNGYKIELLPRTIVRALEMAMEVA